MAEFDAVVVGSGPNGLAAALTLAKAGRSVLVVEAGETAGGGLRSTSFGDAGFIHDRCASVFPLAIASPFFGSIADELSISWLHGDTEFAHPLDFGRAAIATNSLSETAESLGVDARRYRKLLSPIVRQVEELVNLTMTRSLASLQQIRTAFNFAARGFGSANFLNRFFQTEESKALIAGCAGHAILPLTRPLTAGMALFLLATTHGRGWPIVKGGSQKLADDLVRLLELNGGKVQCNWRVRNLSDLPTHRVLAFDTNPAQVAQIAGEKLRAHECKALMSFRHGPGAFKIDYTLDEPVPWTNPACRKSPTLHLAGTASELGEAERQVAKGDHPETPFVLATQPTIVDPTRAPTGKQTFWAYCHVPNGSTFDMTEPIENQIERFAPGFKDIVRTRHTTNAAAQHAYNPNCVGGDIAGGAMVGLQMLFRPKITTRPYNTTNKHIFLCSASTPPGPGVHGMPGFNAANRILSTTLK